MNNLCKIPFLHKYINFIDVSKKPCCNFQGQESPIVIISYASSDPENIPRGSDFFFDFRRLNVSISRAKCLAIILLNSKLLSYYCSSIEDMERLNYFCKLNSLDNNIDNLLEIIN